MKDSQVALTHRPLADADIPIICGFARNREELYFCFPRASWPLTPEQVRESLSIRRDPTVVTRNGQVVGYANFATFEDGQTASIGNVSVDPTLRRQGIADHVVRTMIDRALIHYGLPELTLYCFNTNTPALLLYGKLGMVPIALERRVTPWGEPIGLLKLQMAREVWLSRPPMAA